ncbi:hypothetical protein PTSG_01263 [Salpingoeca rosetta]|uniref:TFIIS N-terminal domain-containing protein n=1 Tax=Salpingoeca rosetta (strain ATCC 50818 / BSB-021) TaxID=946362 RepID=F2TZU5_SALR5|nr:uncharacterized protein PTSG_01263 [Salpingoeca rosetta]EGD80673.1 hypothetical protein PTSG_01263 [Salpingoeca rosetta]|eukprot:XP_004997234.1 hypothetical protein PTSG_01263 [Salpingoeca rosetta]
MSDIDYEKALLNIFAKIEAVARSKDYKRCEKLVNSLIDLRVPTPYVWKHERVLTGLSAIKKSKDTPKPLKKTISRLVKQWINDGEKVDADTAERVMHTSRPLSSAELQTQAELRFGAAPPKPKKPVFGQLGRAPTVSLSSDGASKASTPTKTYHALDASAISRKRRGRFFKPGFVSGSGAAATQPKPRSSLPVLKLFSSLTLQNICLTWLVKHASHLESFGDVPYHIVAPALPFFNGRDLLRIEESHPEYTQHTASLWKKIYQKECKPGASTSPPAHETSWKDEWIKFHDEKEARTKAMKDAVHNAATRVEQAKKATKELSPSQHRAIRATATKPKRAPTDSSSSILKKLKMQVRKTAPGGAPPTRKGRGMIRASHNRLHMKARLASQNAAAATTSAQTSHSSQSTQHRQRPTGASPQPRLQPMFRPSKIVPTSAPTPRRGPPRQAPLTTASHTKRPATAPSAASSSLSSASSARSAKRPSSTSATPQPRKASKVFLQPPRHRQPCPR